jgi:hemin uptake protein HemP
VTDDMMIDRKIESTDPVQDDSSGTVRRIQLADILLGAREAIILHAGQEYRLRITANGRLILTK